MKDIPGYEKRYAISEAGQVWSYPKKWLGHSHNGMFLKHSPISGGYPSVNLIDAAGKPKAIGIHRLLALTYIPNPDNKPHINHIDSDRTNHNLTNLEWVTRSENTLHAAKLGRMTRYVYRKYTPQQILDVRKLGLKGFSNVQISYLLGVPPTTVSAVCTYKFRNNDHKIVKARSYQV